VWAINKLRCEHGIVEGVARQLGVDWHTLWAHVQPKLSAMTGDSARLEGVTALGGGGMSICGTTLRIKSRKRDPRN